MFKLKFSGAVYQCPRLKENDSRRKCRCCGRTLDEYTRYIKDKLVVIGYGLDGDGLFCSADCGARWATTHITGVMA